MGPVVNRSAMDTILSYIEIGKGEGRLLTGGHAVANAEGGYYLEPTVIADVAPTARIAQEEIFGPVLAVIRASDFDHALEIANNTEYGLTGAVYSSSREKLEHARRAFHVGNLYLNRKCTGAMVGAHPFGGFNMSGTDSKAGGPGLSVAFHPGQVDRGEDLGKTLERAEKLQIPPLRCAPVGMTKGRVALPFAVRCWLSELQDPSTRSVENHCSERLKPHRFRLLYVRAGARSASGDFHAVGWTSHRNTRDDKGSGLSKCDVAA